MHCIALQRTAPPRDPIRDHPIRRDQPVPPVHPGLSEAKPDICPWEIHIYIYIYIFREREREREREIYVYININK